MPFILPIVLIVIVVWWLITCIRVVPQEYVCIVERLGKYHCTWSAGIHLKLPIIDKVHRKISLKEQVYDFPPQPVITKDNVTMQIDSVVYMKIFEPKSYTYGIENAINGLANLTATNLRSIVGEMELDQTLSSREVINGKMQVALDEATDPWGIKVTRVEIKNIQPPKEIEEVMTKQMKAERERRETVLQAEAHQESIVKRAEGDKKAKVLAAEAERDAQIAIAEGKAASVKLVYQAEAEGLEMLRSAKVNDTVIHLKAIDALTKVADGNATKIFIPNDMAGLFSGIGAVAETIHDSTPIYEKTGGPANETDDECCSDEVNEITENMRKVSSDIEEDVSGRQMGFLQ